jgi:two-component system phosphate regulon sensor histidine kinase PhoR
VKSKKPLHIILTGSLILGVLTFIILFIIYKFIGIPLHLLWILPLALMALSFLIFFFFVERFIHDKMKLIYRVIRKGNEIDQNRPTISMTEDIMSAAVQDTESWARERQLEITKLKEQAQFRRDFLGNLAHELKTPVFSIQGYILTLLEGGLEDENVNRKFLERASFATERMTAILEDLDEITKMEVNRYELNISRFDLIKLTKDIIESAEEHKPEKKVNVRIQKNYDPIFVKADKGKISQVLTNLILNSINYGKEEGNTVIRFYPMDKVIMTEVSDDGPGIHDKDLPRLFERFYRVEQSRNRNEGGSGLGLAICKHIIESHRQTITVRSTVNVGSTFTFSLPKG